MQKDFKNDEFIEGRLYQHNLEFKTVQNKASANFGKEFIQGTVDIATDEDGLNVIPVHYTYKTRFDKSGKKNATFEVLKSIIDGAKTWITDGKDAALKLRANTAIGLNDFYTASGELVSAKRNEGGFLNVVKDLSPEEQRNSFKTDIIITSVTRVEANPEANIEEDFLKIKGAIFDFRNALLPIEFVCRPESGGMDYFESLDASPANPVYTQVWGNIVSLAVKKNIEEQSAFGTASVRTVTRTLREWQITGARPVEYDFGEEDTITAEELKKAIQDREVYLAGIKKRHDDYIASKNNSSLTPKATVAEGGFDF